MNDIQKQAQEIAAYFRGRQAARNAATPRPTILDEQPPTWPRLAGWTALRQQTEDEYVSDLLQKGALLTPEEQEYLGRAIAAHLRGGL